jgi:hypothetical protein
MKVDEEKKRGEGETNLNRICGQGKLGSRGCATREGTSEEKPMKIASSNKRLQNKEQVLKRPDASKEPLFDV